MRLSPKACSGGVSTVGCRPAVAPGPAQALVLRVGGGCAAGPRLPPAPVGMLPGEQARCALQL